MLVPGINKSDSVIHMYLSILFDSLPGEVITRTESMSLVGIVTRRFGKLNIAEDSTSTFNRSRNRESIEKEDV